MNMDEHEKNYGIHSKIEEIRKEVENAKLEPIFQEEVSSRTARSFDPNASNSCLLGRIITLIAYSQNAKSQRVRELEDSGLLDQIFFNFDVSKVATMDPEQVLSDHWNVIRVIRFKTKVRSMIKAARVILSMESSGVNLSEILRRFPQRIRESSDIDDFWKALQYAKKRLSHYGMPYVSSLTTLLHFLLDIGFDCVKPDMILMRVAARNLEIFPLKEYKEYKDQEKETFVRVVQEYCVESGMRPSVVDLYLLIEGGQTWARKFVDPSFYSRRDEIS